MSLNQVLFVKPNVRLRSAIGRVMLSRDWLELSPNVRLCSIDDKVTLSKDWLNQKPNVSFCTHRVNNEHSGEQITYSKHTQEKIEEQEHMCLLL